MATSPSTTTTLISSASPRARILSTVKAKTTEPLGCGPFAFDGYANGVVTLKANPYYFLGEPKIKTLLMQESVDSDYVPGIVTATFDIAVPSINDDTLSAIQDAQLQRRARCVTIFVFS